MASREKHADTSFWDWLSGNTARLRPGLARGSKRAAEEITREFDKSYDGLVWEVTPADKGPWVFCVSANGDKKLFSRVERAAAAAPRMKDWTVQAFRPRGPAEAEITLNGQSLDGDDVWCEIESVKRGGAVSLVLHLRRVTLETEEVLSQAALILLDNAIGEYDSVMRVAGIDLALLEGKPKRSDRFFPLRDLPAFLDRTREG